MAWVMHITTSCPCGWTFEVPDQRVGQKTLCPACGRRLTIEGGRSLEIPQLEPLLKDESLGNGFGHDDICPFCRSEIDRKALKCRHCHEWLEPRFRKIYMPRQWHPGVAAALSAVVPGLGQIYKGQLLRGLLWFLLVLLGYICLVIPGLIKHIFCVRNAYYSGNPRDPG
jgi:TM2 domain-containing membrane protein YozV